MAILRLLSHFPQKAFKKVFKGFPFNNSPLNLEWH